MPAPDLKGLNGVLYRPFADQLPRNRFGPDSRGGIFPRWGRRRRGGVAALCFGPRIPAYFSASAALLLRLRGLLVKRDEAAWGGGGAAVSCLSTLDERPVGAAADVALLRMRIAKPLPRRGLPSDQVINELAVAVDGGLYGVASGRFFAWVVGGSLPAYVKSETF